MKDINKDFENSKHKSILFLGKIHSLTVDEIKLFLDKIDIKYTDTLDDSVEMFIESSIISPLEEDIAYEAYKKKIPHYKVDQFEELYAKALNSDSILMSLKLSNNQDRLARLLQNHHLDNKLFLKLFNMYDWGEDGLFESSENMEVCTLFAKRFYTKDRFDPATFYSPISIFEIAIMSDDSDVLEVLSNVPELSVKQSRSKDKRPTNIKQALATNKNLNSKTFTKLVRLNDKDIDYFLSSNPLLDIKTAQVLLERSNDDIKIALSTNENISDKIFNELVKNELTVASLLLYQPIDLQRFTKIDTLHSNIGANENLSDEVVKLLMETKNEEILSILCTNESINIEYLKELYGMKNLKFYPYLASNKNFDKLEELYKKNDKEIDISLASNPSSSQEILNELFQRDDFELNKSLALNQALPIEYLQQLQLDTRLLNYLKQNSTFTENILNNLGI